jgi:drug/metabolite transporter (DMT)-like permease
MIDIATVLTLAAVALQSLGKVLYGTFLDGVPTPLFILVGISLTAVVFLASVQFRMPREGRGLLALTNLWTAISFISLFFALKHLPPAMFASLEIGMSLLTAITITSIQRTAWPPLMRLLACLGIGAGCALLSWAEVADSVATPSGPLVWTAIAAAIATGATSTLTATACRKLATMGWSSRAVLAHRFHLTIAVAVAWFAFGSLDIAMPGPTALGFMVLVGAVGLLLPLLLLQVALRRVDELTVMICMAAQPILSFLISLPSPAYDWNVVTFCGVLVVSLFVGVDIATQHTNPSRSARGKSVASVGQPSRHFR